MRCPREVLVRVGRCVLASSCLLSLSCGSSGTVSGKVTYNGQAVPGGVVVFVADGTRGTMSATIGEDGSYRVENVPSGPVKIAVKTAAPSRQPPPAQTKAWEGDKMPEKFRQQKRLGEPFPE